MAFEQRLQLKRYRRCSVPRCRRKHHGNGYCWEHNRRFKLYDNPNYTKRKPRKVRNHKEEK